MHKSGSSSSCPHIRDLVFWRLPFILSAGCAVFLLSGRIACADLIFLDNFSASADTTNLDFGEGTRQSGIAAPLNYSTLAVNLNGSVDPTWWQLVAPDDNGWLRLEGIGNPSSAPGVGVSAMPDFSFTEGTHLTVDFDIIPYTVTAAGGWCGVKILDSTGTPVFVNGGDGFGVLINNDGSGTLFDGGTALTSFGGGTFDAIASNHVTLAIVTGGFDGSTSGQTVITLTVNSVQVSITTINHNYKGDYISLFYALSGGPTNVTSFDNLEVQTVAPAPPIPMGLSATMINSGVLLTWTASTGATTYNVKRATTSGGTYATIASVTSPTYTDTNLVAGVTYYYEVSAVNASGESANSTFVTARDTMSDTWAAIDDLGRNISENATVGNPKSGKTVGMFYYMWQQGSGINTDNQGRIFDNTQVLSENPTLAAAPWNNSLWNAVGSGSPGFQYWAQPLFGYYSMLSDVNHVPDDWVIRKHCQMLVDAGVDVIIFDVTNGFTYDGTWQEIMNVYAAIRAAGGRTPQVMFITYSSSGVTAQHLYSVLYSANFHPGLWFMYQGKPLIFGQTSDTNFTSALQNFFTVRNCWAFPGGTQNDWWWWTDNYPQHSGLSPSGTLEEICMAPDNGPFVNQGRSYTTTGGSPYWPGPFPNSGSGLYLAQQWSAVEAVNPPFLYITQWNEWIAQRLLNSSSSGPATFLNHPQANGDTYFVDEFNPEYSRDLEPVTGFYGDDYYWQTVDYIRRFKGARAAPAGGPPVTINLNNFNSWTNASPQYFDDIGDVFHRNSKSVLDLLVYTNNTGRNDFQSLQVARDATNVYFYAQTVSNITAEAGINWMNLFIGVEGSSAANWQKFQFLVRPQSNSAGAPMVICDYSGSGTNWNWSAGTTVTMTVSSNQMAISIPRTALGLSTGQTALNLRFKWADNMQTNTPLDWLVNGDTAPNARFAYRYAASETVPPKLTALFMGGNTLTLSWLTNYAGYHLQSQTNAPKAGLGTNWLDVTNGSNSPVVISFSRTNGSVYFRLTSP